MRGTVGAFVGLASAPSGGLPRGLDTDGQGHLLVGEVIADVHLMSTDGGSSASTTFPCPVPNTPNPDGVATEGVPAIGNRVYIALLDHGLVAKFYITAAQVPASCLPQVFDDGFESGDSSAWQL